MMKHFLKGLLFVLAIILLTQCARPIEMGKIPPQVELKDKLGGRPDGTPWSSEELQGKVSVLSYVDPDVNDMNNAASDALDREKFPSDKFQAYEIINVAATWVPNFAIDLAISYVLKEKQKRYPRTIYVLDYKKVLVHAWNIADENSDILAFDKKGQLIFKKEGKLNGEEIKTLIKTIREHL